MRSARLALTALLALGLSVPAHAAPKPRESWGRAGVSFETYRADAEECGRLAYYADVSQTEHAQAFVRATSRLEASDDHGMAGIGEDEVTRMVQIAARSEQIRASVRPEKRMRELQQALQSIVDDCLTERGYVKFRLSDEQRDRLEHMRKGSPERHRYLHMLASDPDVIARQAITS